MAHKPLPVILVLQMIVYVVLAATDELVADQPTQPVLKQSHPVYTIVATACVLLLLHNFFHNQQRRKPPKRSMRPDCFRLAVYAHLASMSYCTTTIKQSRDQSATDIIVPNLDASSSIPIEVNDAGNILFSRDWPLQRPNSTTEFRIEVTCANNTIWLLRSVSSTPGDVVHWVVIFRGTKTLDDVVTDLRLIAAVASEHSDDFSNFLSRRETQLQEAFEGNDVRKTDLITLVGHSLGASVAEAMSARLYAKGYEKVAAYAFDSPGIPDSERSKYPSSPQNKLIMVYARDNPVNNLCPAPSHAIAYVTDTRDPLEIRSVWDLVNGFMAVTSLQYLKIFVSIKSLFKLCLGPHCIARIASGIERGTISRDECVSARRVSGMVLQGFSRILNWGRGSPKPSPDNSTPMRSKKKTDELRRKAATKPPLEHKEFPGAAVAVREFDEERNRAAIHNHSQRVVPYCVTDLRNFTRGISPGKDIVIPFIGLTSVGKSSLLKAILQLSPDDDTIRVGAVMNVTVTPVVILWKMETVHGEQYRVWLMDLPGVRGSSMTQQDQELNEFVDVDIPTQLELLKETVQAACFVCGDNAKEEDKALYAQAYNAFENRLVVAHNVKGLICDDNELTSLTDEIRREFGSMMGREDERGALKVVRVKVARARGASAHLASERGVGQLTTVLLQSYKVWKNEVKEKLIRKRKDEREKRIALRAEEIEREMPIFWDGVGVAATGMGTAAGTAIGGVVSMGAAESVVAIGAAGAATAAPGAFVAAGAFAAAAGPVVVAAAPVVGVIGAVAVYFTNKHKRKKAARAQAEREQSE